MPVLPHPGQHAVGGCQRDRRARTARLRRAVEAGRAIIVDQRLIGGRGLESGDCALFAELMLAGEMRSYRMTGQEPAPAVFFDHGIPELTRYFLMRGLPVPAHSSRRPEFGPAGPAWRTVSGDTLPVAAS